MRIGGLASGMDTDTMIKDMMKAESIKVDRVKAEKQIAEWRKESLNSLNKDFANFIIDSKKDFGYNNLGRPGSNMDWVKKAISSDEKIATVKGNSKVPEGNHSIEVKNLAEGVKGGSNETIKSYEKIGAMSITINGATITTDENSTIEDFVIKINSATKKVYETDKNGEIVKDTNGKPVVKKDEKGKDIEIGIGVKASYDGARFFISSEKTGATDGEIKFTANDKAAADFINETLDLRLSSSRITSAEGVEPPEYGEYSSKEVELEENKEKIFSGIDAKIEYNGIEIEQGSNNFNVNGMNLTIRDVGKINVNVSTDIDGIVEKVKDFINNYNTILDKAGSLISEKKNRNYKPLTEEERKALSEKEVELWDEKAKSGVIRDDADIARMLASMRSSLYENVAGDHGKVKYMDKGVERIGDLNNITQLGITTQKYKPGASGGQLMLDEKKLREVLSYNADGVMSMLFQEDKDLAIKDDNKLSTEDRTKKRSNSGMVTRIYDGLIVGMKELIGKAGTGGADNLFKEVRQTIMGDFVTKGGRYSGAGSVSDLDSDLMKFTKKIDDLNAYLFKRENMYHAQFTAMEKAMQKAASQSGWLQQQM